jgi:hypothetical protein
MDSYSPGQPKPNAGSHPLPSLEDAALFQDYLDSISNETRVKPKKGKSPLKDKFSTTGPIVNDPDVSTTGPIVNDPDIVDAIKQQSVRPVVVKPTPFPEKPSSGFTTGVRPIPGRPGSYKTGSVMDDPVVNVQPGEVSWLGTGGNTQPIPSDEAWFRRGKFGQFDIRNPNEYLQSLNPNMYALRPNNYSF